jgi:anthranilate synthase/aminodeoxychorismate synthase-like glutamine amidotransferase
MILVIDNYDSFTYNLVQALEAAQATVRVVRNDEITATELGALADDATDPLTGILISPGPGRPEDSGVSIAAIELARKRELPLLGVCLGMQAIAAQFGASVKRAPTLVHGEASSVRHDAKGYLASMPLPFPAARYHSLCVDAGTLPPEVIVSALADDGVVMGIRHKTLPMEGVQFHPESVLTPDGPRILARFLRRCDEGEPSVLESRRDFCFKGIAA